MGRPRLYNSPEEKALAKGRDAKAWYERNKKAVNKAKKKERKRNGALPRAKKRPRGEQKPEVSEELPPKEKTREECLEDNLKLSVRKVNGIPKRFREALDGHSPSGFLEMVCERCIKIMAEFGDYRQAIDWVSEMGLPFAKLRSSLETYQGFLLQLGPLTNEYKSAKGMWKDLKLMSAHFDDIMCRAMTGELAEDLARERVDFQMGFELSSL